MRENRVASSQQSKRRAAILDLIQQLIHTFCCYCSHTDFLMFFSFFSFFFFLFGFCLCTPILPNVTWFECVHSAPSNDKNWTGKNSNSKVRLAFSFFETRVSIGNFRNVNREKKSRFRFCLKMEKCDLHWKDCKSQMILCYVWKSIVVCVCVWHSSQILCKLIIVFLKKEKKNWFLCIRMFKVHKFCPILCVDTRYSNQSLETITIVAYARLFVKALPFMIGVCPFYK